MKLFLGVLHCLAGFRRSASFLGVPKVFGSVFIWLFHTKRQLFGFQKKVFPWAIQKARKSWEINTRKGHRRDKKWVIRQ